MQEINRARHPPCQLPSRRLWICTSRHCAADGEVIRNHPRVPWCKHPVAVCNGCHLCNVGIEHHTHRDSRPGTSDLAHRTLHRCSIVQRKVGSDHDFDSDVPCCRRRIPKETTATMPDHKASALSTRCPLNVI
eukprot:1554306-Rhodomonas_salina.2